LAQAVLATVQKVHSARPEAKLVCCGSMATARPVVSVYKFDDPSEKTGTVPMPAALVSPLRPDWVHYVHYNLNKNRRAPISVGAKVGYETAAESWGTGRAVARVPRAPGGGTHRAGQGAFGNMCRGGGMFSPTKTWRRWHRRIPVKLRRHAVVSALSASTLPPLVMARGHRISEVQELPLVVSDGIESMTRTRPTVKLLEKLGLKEDLQRVIDSKVVRAGKGKARNRRYVMRCGPMVIYRQNRGIVRAMRNIPGLVTCNVRRINILKLAPGGHFGRLLLWTEGAFRMMKKMYGTGNKNAPMKKRYVLPRAEMENADIARIINSTEVQSVLRPKLEPRQKALPKVNALVNKNAFKRLNPYERPKETTEDIQKRKKARMEEVRKYRKEHKKGDNTFWKRQMRAYEPKPKEEAEEEDEE